MWPFRGLRLVTIPDLNGTWKGYLKSSYDQFTREYVATLEIKQTWTKISLALNTKTSSSKSLIAAIVNHAVEKPLLTYQYANEPRVEAVQTMHVHRGTACL